MGFRCMICGSWLPIWSDKINRKDLFWEMHDYFVSLKCIKPYDQSYDFEFCEECQANIETIKNKRDYESSYRTIKRKARPYFLENCRNSDYLDHIYRIRKKVELKKEFTNKTSQLVEKRWTDIKKTYGNIDFAFPKSQEHSHVCAARFENNLILVENRKPLLKVEEGAPEEKFTNAFEKISNLNNEAFFAISVIPVDNIVSYQSTGYVEHTTTVSGGGGYGGGINKKGAVIGGLLFGGAGAIIGAQKGTEIFINPITSDVVEYDYRKTMLNLKNAQGQVEIKELPYYYAEVFQKVIPEKEHSFLQANKNAEVQTQISSTNMLDEMKQLKELLDIGLITQEEFDAKRTQILKL